jgi:alpha-tubulin suppressor-like RCC1 family protein
VPSPNTGFTAIAAGVYHSLGLKTDGSVVAWGDYFLGQGTFVPSPNTGFTAIAASGHYSLGLQVCLFDMVGDLNDDGKVDFDDLAILADQWLHPPGTPSADIAPLPSGDGAVNFLDFTALAENWLIDCDANPSNPACVPK